MTLQDELELAFKVHSSTPNGSTSMAAADQEESQLQSRSDHEGSESHPLLVIAMVRRSPISHQDLGRHILRSRASQAVESPRLGRAIAEALHLPFVDGDSLHPPSNIDKMSAGIPLTDEDRKPWLELIRNRAEHFAAEQQHHWHHALTGSWRSRRINRQRDEVREEAAPMASSLPVRLSSVVIAQSCEDTRSRTHPRFRKACSLRTPTFCRHSSCTLRESARSC